ncbi:efflux RND transporter permease subunit [Alistipes indistinctus]|uniref:efflux RND transporter permease subunit n=1 Tax=Alistipes indistinctus TaxID=626932 RepID=UPI0026DBF89A|nr:efflux RND transporter permease subunit [Alistipes indistinctus]
MGNIFIRRPIFAMVIAIMIVVLGLIGIQNTPIEQYPDITPPMVQVSADYQGADALTVEQSIATPIEESVNGVSDMLYMQSTNSNDGSMSLQVTFGVGSNPDMNTIYTQNRVASATPQLPAAVITQGVTTQKTTTSYIMVLSLFSADGRYDETFLSNYAMLNIKDRIARINGVGQVQVLGSGAYAMRVWIKPDKMDYLGLTVADIAGAITSQSEVVPGGQLGAEPTAEKPDFTYTVRMPSPYNTAEQFGNVIVRANPDGSLVRLHDVATIELGTQSYSVSSTYQGHDAVLMIINQSPGSNAVQVGKEVKALLSEMSQSFPEGITYDTLVDSTKTITSGIQDIVTTLLIALLLVIAVIYLFLQDFRATFVPLIVIPVALIGAFMLFPLFGFSVNVFSLLGLVLAIGLVVDDAIVVVEAVQVNLEQGMKAKEATQAAMKSVSSSIVAMTTVLMAVFLPVGLMPGAAGKLYQQFAITIAITVCISGINALSLTPALCSLLLRPKRQAERKGFLGWFNRTFKKSVDDYLKTSNVIIRHSARTLVLIGIVVAVVLLFVKTVPTGFLPDEDQGYLMADIQLPNAASLGRTQEVIDQLQEVLSKNDNIQSVTAAAGFSLLSGTEAPNSGLVFIRLKDYKQRKMTADEISDMLNGELYEAINSAEVFTFGPPSIPGLGPGSGFTIMIQDKGGNTPQYLAQYTDKFIGEARKRPEIASISTLYQADIPQKAIRINNEKVLKAGVSLQDLHEKISAYLGGSYVNNFNRFGRMYQTYIQAASEYRLTQSDLDLFYITNNRGESLPIASFITVKDTTGPQYTNRFNLYRAASVTGQPAKGYSTGETMQALEEVAARVLPSDMGYAWSNMSYQDAHTTGEATVFLYAIIFIFLILAALYESWSLPLSIILGIPFAVFGAMLFIFLGHLLNPKYINDIFLQVSLIMLIGLAAKNAILIVEYAKAKFDEGLSLRDAAIEGARLRVRPVIMTAFAFLMGVIPLIFATGSNAVARNVMGLGLFGGMLIATLIGIFAYPALFVWIGKIGKYEQKRTAKQQEMTNSEHHE